MSLLGYHLRGRQALILIVGIALAVAGLVPVASRALAASDPCGPGGNAIACENTKPGTPSAVWDDMWGAGDDSIQGFATDISVNAGSRIDFKIDTDASDYDVTIYRIGYYQGHGARRITAVEPSAPLPQHQPECITVAATELYDCGNWIVSASWDVPASAVSGVYLAHLKRPDTGKSSHITFVVRNDSSHSDIVFQTADTTWQAYNDYGGSSFYHGGANGRAFKVSYNRPFATRSGSTNHDFFFANEYPAIRFLERNGYDVTYLAGVDADRHGSLLLNHKTYLSVGHDEYWSGAQRANVEAARDAGVNLMFLSGNEMYWRTRYEPSEDPSHTPYRTLVSYKETWANEKIDPSSQWTGTWRDPRFAPKSAGGGRPENGLTGTMYMSNFTDLPVTVSADEGKLRLWRGTSLATMTSGTAELAPHTVGYESNEDVDNGDRPPGLIRLSTTTGPVPQYLQDFGNDTAPGTTTHHVTLYRAPSGALVFSAGSVQWTWGLDSTHDSDYAPSPADIRMQQAQVNLLADMGAQPTTLMEGLLPATMSTDEEGPTVTIDAPAAGAVVSNGAQSTLSGTATDVGGRVAGVEVSTDGGVSWHPAEGRESWSYTYSQSGSGALDLRVRAIDDSANIGPVATRAVTVKCPCTVFGSATPPIPAADDAGDAELGLRFTPQADGFVSGVRFYKGPGNGGTHVGSLWSSSGQRLAQATFTNETASGWQTVTFAVPVAVSAGQTYVASYTAPQGHYSLSIWAFAVRGINAAPLTVDGGYGASPAGVFAHPGEFPAASYRNANYFVDPVFTTVDESPLIATSRWPLPGSSSVPATVSVSAQFTKPIVPGSAAIRLVDANDVQVAGSTTYDSATRTVTFTPRTQLSGFVRHTATVSGTDAQGNDVSTGKTWSFTTAKPPSAPGVCPCTLFDDIRSPSLLESSDPGPVTLGVRFKADSNGSITGVRFYKSAGNTGTHTGALWTATGTLLAQGTFVDESTSGWQTLMFEDPVPISKNATYVASYRAPVGRWSADLNFYNGIDLNRSPLHVMAGSGAYTYGTGFPGSTSASNYLVDVLFERGAPTVAIAAYDPAPGALDVARRSPVKVTFTEPIVAGASLTVRPAGDPAATPIAGSTTRSPDGATLTFTPAGALPPDAELAVSLSGVVSVEGATLPAQSWTFRTRSPDGAGSQTLFSDVVPDTAAANDAAPVELGTVVKPTKSGKVTAIRFYKGPGNEGTHVGSLWTIGGQRLATVTFTDETATGWQTATLASPVSLAAGSSYVVSYLAPQGHYAFTPGFFQSSWSSGLLTSPAGANGRYLYGAAGGFPVNDHNSTNYFVDVVFQPDPPSVTIGSRTPGSGATDVVRSVRPSVTFSEPIVPGWSMTVQQGTTPVPGAAQLSSDQRTLRFVPSAALDAATTYTVTVSGVVSVEDAALGTQSWSFETEVGSTATVSLFGDETPAIPAVNEGLPIELGTAFTPSVDGVVTAVRFYKGEGNTGTHTGSLWTDDGTLLGRVTFTDESETGWQTATFATPVPVSAGNGYVVSYFAPKGRFAIQGGYFQTPKVVGPLTAPATRNGRYRYGSVTQFPIDDNNAASYFVDVVFRHATP